MTTQRGTIFIRLAVGLIFLTQGVLKYTDAHMGVERFTRIGFPDPTNTADFVGACDVQTAKIRFLFAYRLIFVINV